MDMEWRDSATRRSIQDLNKVLLENGRFSDVTFLVGPDKVAVNAHTFVLSTRSAVFEAMFSSVWAESAQRVDDKFVVDITDVDPSAFRGFLKFLYSDSTDSFTSPLEILYLGQKYNVVELVKICAAFLSMSLQVSNVIGIYEAARLFDLEELQESAMAYMLKNSDSLIEHPDFLNMDVETLCSFISDDALELNELEVFKCLLRWAKAECERQELVPSGANYRIVLDKLIQHVRFPLMAPQEFSAEVVNSGVLKSEEIIALFLHFNNKKVSGKKEVLDVLPFDSSPRNHYFLGNKIKELKCLLPRIYSAGLYLSSKGCCPNSNSYTIGSLGKLHEENLDFTVSRTIELLGIGFYGPSKSTLFNERTMKKYTVDLNLFSYTLAHEFPKMNEPVSRASRAVMTRDDYEVHFQRPVRVLRDKVHHLRIAFKGEETKHGVTKLSTITTTCKDDDRKVTFNFLGPIGNHRCHPEGRIRSIIFTIV